MFILRSCRRASSMFLRIGFVLCLSSFAVSVHAFNTYLDTFNANYGTSGTRLNSCGLCHFDFNGGGARTSYGEDFRNNNYNPVTIGSFDSDGDGFSNDEEAAAGTLTFPGLSCSDLANVLNAPADLADYVDPSNFGCIGPGQEPVANANGPYAVVNGEPGTFSSAGSADPDGTIVSYFWDFGGYGSSTEANPTFTFNISFEARVTISLTVTDNEGNSTTATAFVFVLDTPNSPPTADAGSPVSGAANSVVQFNGSGSFDPDGANLEYTWDFGDENTGSGVQPSHSYGRCGTYTVTLTVADDIGLTGSATTTATISSTGVDAPVANAGGGTTGHYDGELGINIQFDGSASADPDCDIVDYNWDFGDGTGGQGVNPVHSYTQAGDYVVTLIVTDNDSLTATSTATVSVVDTGPLDGAALYSTHCAGCHGVGDATTKAGAGVTRINDGIANVPAMNGLATSLSAAQIQAIADYLVSLTPPNNGDGATLYANNCASCHGAGDNSAKAGASVGRINDGITNVTQMNYLSGVLSATDIQAIADFLATSSPPTGGEGLYAANCAACHGADGSGGSSGENVEGESAKGISEAIYDESEMNYLSFLSADEIQQISDFLNGVSPPPSGGGGDGADLYASNCAGCHGAGDSSAKAGATAARINNGISSVSSMGYLSGVLSQADVQAIADFLATSAPPTTPEGRYVTYCASCHGVDGKGGSSGEDVRGASRSEIDEAIEDEKEMKFLDFLSSEEIKSIAGYLDSLSKSSKYSSWWAKYKEED